MKKKLTLEDTTMYYNKWVQGIAAREFSAQRTKFKDLFKQSQDVDQTPNNAKAGNVLPYQLSQAATILGDLITNTTNAISAFEDAKNNPVVQKDKGAEEEIDIILAHLKRSMGEIDALMKTIVTTSIVSKDR